MIRQSLVMSCLLTALGFATHTAVAQERTDMAPAAVIQFENAQPLNLQTVFFGKSKQASEVLDASDSVLGFSLSGLQPQNIIAQREATSSRVWFLASLRDPALRGRNLEIAAERHALKHVVSIRETAGGLEFIDAGRPVLTYVTTPQSHDGKYIRNGFVHPLHGLNGEVLTQSFPADHLHHHGVFWAWHQLWVGDQRAGDPWVTDDFLAEMRDVRIITQGPVFATMRARLHWTSPKIVDTQGKRRGIIEETTTIRVFHATDSAQLVDFEIQLKPLLDDVRLGGAENERGYSGFTVRVRPPQNMKIMSDTGGLQRDAVGTRSRWADVTGHFSDGEQDSGIAILGHPGLPEFPPRWLLRFYGMQNVVYPGRTPVALSAKTPLVLRHRLVIHRGDAFTARINDQQRVYEMGR